MMGSVNYITTIINLRAAGMTLYRMPMTIWAMFITAILQAFALPVLTVALILQLLDKTINTTFFLPAKGTQATTYTASGLPDDSSVQFLPRTPDVEGTEARTMRITIGPDTPAGTYVVTVKASRDDIADQFNYVLVFVDCQPPFILGINDLGTQTQSVVSGQKANLKVVPGGNGPLKYQWYQGHSGSTAFPIAGATSNSLATPAITTATEFWVRVTNACGSRDSATATVSPR